MTGLKNTVYSDDNIRYPLLHDFDIHDEIDLHVIDWHAQFDALIGSRDLKRLNGRIDYQKNILKLGKAKIPFVYEFTEKKIQPKSFTTKSSIRVPVSIADGDVLLPEIKISDEYSLPESIATSCNGYVTLPLDCETDCNFSERITVDPLFQYDIQNPNNPSQKIELDFSQLIRTAHMNPEEKQTILDICKTFKDIMYFEDSKLTFTNKVKHHIRTTNEDPIYTKSYRHPYVLKQEIQKQIEKLLNNDIIRPSISPYSSPVWIVPKKADASGQKKYRMVIDYRRLNEQTIEDKYPLPRIEEILENLGKCTYYSSIDLAQAFNQIEMDPRSIEKTAFTVENGHYEYLRMPFGLKNAPSTFQRVMDDIFKEYLHKFCFVYLDDIIIFSKSLNEHYQHIRKVFQKLRTYNLKIQLDKCEFFKKEVEFLGHVITPSGILPNPQKIRAIENYPIPNTTKQIKAFLGLTGYYRRFIKDFSKIVAPMTKYLKKDTKFDVRDPDYIEAFETCKQLITNAPILAYPDFDQPFTLTTDASNVALGGVLSQNSKPISFYSRTLNSAERNYATIEKELLSIIECTKHFRPYLFGRQFKIETDHNPLVWLYSRKEPLNARLFRWKLRLQEFDFTLNYIKGKTNVVADALSRIELHNNDENDDLSIRPNIDEIPELTDDDLAEILGPQNLEPLDIDLDRDLDPTLPPNQNPPDDEDIDTVHTGVENTPLNIVMTDRPVNLFSNRIIIRTGESFKRRIARPFNKNTHLITVNALNADNEFREIMNDTIEADKTYGVFIFDLQLKYTFCNLASKTLNNGKFKLFICDKYLNDVTTLEEQEKIVNEYHNKTHTGILETENHLKIKYYWPKMRDIITKIINTCSLCLKSKYERNPYVLKFQGPLLAKRPFQILHLDTFSFENSKFLTIIDLFSRYAQAYFIKGTNAINILDKLRHYFSHHNIPEKITCDEGTEFKNHTFEEYCILNKIQLHYTTINNPQSNSPIERFHSTLVEKLRILKLKNPRETPANLVITAILLYNQTIHSSTGHSPFHLLYGPYERLIDFDRNLTVYENYNEKRKQELLPFYDEIYEKNKTKATATLEKQNTTRQEPPDIVDQEVYMARNRPRKADPPFEPLRVVGQDKGQLIGMTDKNRITTTNIEKVKRLRRIPYLQDKDGVDNPTPPSSNPSPVPGPSNAPD